MFEQKSVGNVRVMAHNGLNKVLFLIKQTHFSLKEIERELVLYLKQSQI